MYCFFLKAVQRYTFLAKVCNFLSKKFVNCVVWGFICALFC